VDRPRVLVVEPSDALREIEGEVLIRGGFYPCPAETLERALLQLDACAPHLVLTTYALPDGTGAGLVERMHQAGAYPAIVGVTDRDAARAALRKAGVVHFLAKPFTARELLEIVRLALV
jgi:DNA-binding response OmpR family regulator